MVPSVVVDPGPEPRLSPSGPGLRLVTIQRRPGGGGEVGLESAGQTRYGSTTYELRDLSGLLRSLNLGLLAWEIGVQ